MSPRRLYWSDVVYSRNVLADKITETAQNRRQDRAKPLKALIEREELAVSTDFWEDKCKHRKFLAFMLHYLGPNTWILEQEVFGIYDWDKLNPKIDHMIQV